MTSDVSRSDTQGANAREALERFVVENDDLLALESRIGRFNIFDALGIARAEIRHSNFLAFILDPAESHGQGQLVLKAVLMDLLKTAQPELRPLSPIELDGTDLRGVEVRREWKNIDLLVTCAAPRFAVVIENKVGAQEHSDQLSRYRQVMAEHFPDVAALYVYLTPEGDEPSEDLWVPYTYADIHRLLKRVRDTNHTAIGTEVLVFIDHYLNLLGARFMNDDKLDDLCRQIYKNHRQALDLIWERVRSPEAAPLAEAVTVLEQDPRWHVLYRSSRYVEFMPKAWLDWLPQFGHDDDYPLCFHIRARETTLGYTMFVGPMTDVARRKELITRLRDDSPGCGFKRSRAFQVEGKWNRIVAVERILEWADDDEPDPAAVRASVKKSLADLYPKVEKLASILKPFFSVPLSSK